MQLKLTLLVATASVETAVLAMNILNNKLHNKMKDHGLNHSLFTYI